MLKMENYIPLTLKIKNIDGTDDIICAFAGTDKCPIHEEKHADGHCICPMMASLLRQQLNIFEEIYLDNNI